MKKRINPNGIFTTPLTKQQRHLLFKIREVYFNEEYSGVKRHLELFTGCGYVRQAYALVEKGFIEINRNSNGQLFLCLKDYPYQLETF